MADDDFWSDKDTKKKETDTLAPIVEVSSGANDSVNTARSDSTTTTQDETPRNNSDRDDYSDDDYDDDQKDEDSEEDETPRSTTSSVTPRKRRKHKSKNGKYPIDLTPPDKHLKRSEKKIKRYIKQQRADDAIKEMILCTALTRIVHGQGHWTVARAHANLAAGYLDLKNYPAQGQYHSDLARSMMMSSVQTSSSDDDKSDILEVLCNIYYTLGRSLTQLKKFSEAEQHLLKAEKISQERSKIASVSDDDLDDWDTNIYIAIARLSGKAQKPAIAQEYFEKALDIIEDRFGKESTKLIPIYQGLGMVEQSKGRQADHEKAIEHFLKAHSISTAKYKDSSPQVAETARALATAYSNVGEEDAETSAESYLNECLAVYQVVHGPNHQKTIDIQDELAKIMIRTDRRNEGIELLKSTIEPKEAVFGEYSAGVAETLKLIGSVQLSQGETNKALKVLKKCHNMETLVYGSNSKKSKDTQKTIDLLLANPNLAAKHKNMSDSLKERPRFNSIVSRASPTGGFKSQTY